jgi:hypothetical protein
MGSLKIDLIRRLFPASIYKEIFKGFSITRGPRSVKQLRGQIAAVPRTVPRAIFSSRNYRSANFPIAADPRRGSRVISIM